jgi:hypothetical protein
MKSRWKLLVFVFVLLAFFILVFLILVLVRKDLRSSLVERDESLVDRIVEDTWKAEENIGDWKTNRYEEFGFEMKLPPGCQLFRSPYEWKGNIFWVDFWLDSECYNKKKDDENGGVTFRFFSMITNEGTQNPCGIENRVTLTSNNPMLEAKLCYMSPSQGFISYNYAFVRNGKSYTFFTGHSDKTYNIKIEKAILNSFRFID